MDWMIDVVVVVATVAERNRNLLRFCVKCATHGCATPRACTFIVYAMDLLWI